MILNALKDDKNIQEERNSMVLHRQNFDKYRKILETTKIGQQLQLHKKINLQQINSEKQKIIRDLDKIDGGADQQFQYFEELAFYQERYLQLIKYLKRSSDPRASTPTEIQFQEIKNNFCKDARMSVGIYELDQANTMNKKNNKQNTDKEIKFSNLQFDQSQNSGIKGLLQANNSKNQLQSFESIKGTGITKPIFEFFERKQREKKTTKFRDIAPRPIQNKSPVSSINMNRSKRTVIKKPAQSIQIQKLLQQNKRLYQMLQKRQKQENQLDSFEKNVLREERERCMRRIQQLEEQVQQLERNNYRLKIAQTQKSKNHPPNDTMNWNQSQHKIYQPYALNIRHNDLGKLSTKNNNNNNKLLNQQSQQFLDMDLGIPPIQKKQQKIFKKSNFQNDFQNDSGDVVLQDFLLGQNQMNQIDRNVFKRGQDYGYSVSIERGSRFDSFSMANTAYNNSSLFLNASKNLVNIDSQTSTRNKVAFFKKSLIIVKDTDYEIAFKKSALDPTKTKQRLIFYIQNKTNSRQKVNIDYDYQFNHYQINVTESLGQLAANSQGREVIEVGLARQCVDLNSVIDCHIKLGRIVYDIWVPVCFMEFSYADSPAKMRSNQHMIVQPDRQFRSYELASKILPLSKQSMHSQDESQAYLTATSKFGQFDIAINWWQKQMTIETHPKILDLLGFIFHHFK